MSIYAPHAFCAQFQSPTPIFTDGFVKGKAKKTRTKEETTLILMGKIVRPHGIHGELRVVPMTDWPERFESLKSFYLVNEREGDGRWVQAEESRIHGDDIILKLRDIEDRNTAETLRGYELWVSRETLPPLPEDMYYISDLIGCSVKIMGGRVIGTVKDIHKMAAQDIYVIDIDGREVMIPAVKEFIQQIDIRRGEIIITPIEGLLNPDED